ncbi:MAG: hypothetical protein FWC88_01330, partial [Endomicrobia bacterium]|nr:hypothetical protein [Endomicrobiia bacterium]
MKRKLSFLILISAAVFFANTAFAQTTETVGDFNGFNAAISSNVPVMTINFSENITVNGNIYEQAAGTLTINGFGYNLDGDNFGSYIVVNNDTQILNISSLTVVNFSSGFSDEAGLTRGGAIFSSGSVNIDSSVFTDNYAQSLSSSSDTFAYGGAVWLNNNFNVSISSFINNFASAAVTENDIIAIAAGGAVYIDSASANAVSITSGLFDGNYAFAQCISSASATAMGGAIYNNATEAFIYNSTFTNNYATALSSAAGTTNACGGAIYNASTLTVVNSYFAFNSINSSGGQALGGAIYNADNAVLYIVADGENTVFEGNKANGRSNAIHNSSGAFVYLNASSGNEIIFNDSISGNLTGEIHINSAAVSSSTGGTVVLNNALTSNSIYLYSGTLSLGNFDGIRDSVSTWTYIANPSRGSIGGTNNADKCDLYISDLAVFNLSNGNATDNVYLRNFSVESGTATLLFDVDLANLRWDTINVSSTLAGSGILDVSKLTILTDISSGVSANVRVIVSTYTPDNNYFAGVDFNLYRYRADLSSSVYHITEGAEFGALNFTLTGYYDDTFQQAVLDTGERTLQLESGYYAGSEYNSVLGTGTFTINAISSGTSAITINGANNTNLFVLSDNNVNLDLINVYIINGSSDTGGAIYNAGSVSVSELVFSGNTAVSSETALGGAVFNDGVFTVQNSSFTYNTASGSVAYGGAVYNSSGAISEIIDTSFINNSAGTSGGAIYNDGGTVNIIAGLENSEFSGNKAAGISNAICVSNGGVINLNAGLAQIIFNDNITSSGNANIININQTGLSFPSSGTIVINADMSGFNNSSGTFSGNTVNFYGGTIQFGSNAVFFNDADFYMYSGATLNMNNGKIDTISLDNFNLPESGEAFVCLDVDLRAASADNFIGTVLSDNT